MGSKAWRQAAERRPNGERRLARWRVGSSHLALSKNSRFADAVFKFDFLWIFKLKCTLQSIAKLKIKDPSSTIAKASRGFIQGIEQEQHAKLAKISAPMNSKPAP
jgi:hypothetical protein